MTTSERRIDHWNSQRQIFVEIVREGFQGYASSLPDIARAFVLQDRSLRCIDEGTSGGVHAAGSGILMAEPRAIVMLRRAGLDGIYSHAGCGAAALYAERQSLDVSKSDEYGQAWAKRIAERLGVPYRGHITREQMKRPAEFHIARVAYYDATGRFDPSRVHGLPPGFVISRGILDQKDALQEVDLSISIAMGDHGFGKLITPDEPFYIVAVSDPDNPSFSVDVLRRELAAAVARGAGRVKLELFTPERAL